MREQPQAAWITNGKRLRLWHGPIDLIIEATGAADQVLCAYQRATEAFTPLLEELADELPLLRTTITKNQTLPVQGKTAQAMCSATSTFADIDTVTPMIAVAGAVADHVLTHMTEQVSLQRAAVNNGGDIALFVAHPTSDQSVDDARWVIGLAANPTISQTPTIGGKIHINHKSPVRGIATSGWRGRSHSLGIADAVTVLAKSGAVADVAATLLANAVDLPHHPAIKRAPACSLVDDSDLGERLVTTAVGQLSRNDIKSALHRASVVGESLLARGDIVAAHAILQGETLTIGRVAELLGNPTESHEGQSVMPAIQILNEIPQYA